MSFQRPRSLTVFVLIAPSSHAVILFPRFPIFLRCPYSHDNLKRAKNTAVGMAPRMHLNLIVGKSRKFLVRRLIGKDICSITQVEFFSSLPTGFQGVI